jgi:hypothetical protein
MINGVRTVTLLALGLITISKTGENILKLKKMTGILDSVIKIQYYRAPNKIMQCFCSQGLGHKAEFGTAEIAVLSARGIIHPVPAKRTLFCRPRVGTNKGITPPVIRGAQRKKRIKKGRD